MFVRFVMLGRETPVAPLTLSLRTLAASAWVNKWHTTASWVFLAAMTGDNLTLHSAAGGEWLVSVNWSSERVSVIERGESSPHRFSGMKTALTFLDALLLHYVAKIEETCAGVIPPLSPVADSL
jgi:hypothetical protein